ncbi:MAG: hypothetical protein KDA94_15700 [Acidimicrobiales bacterium]|nr:hypothetical protein [Acidimicrobiales bacterium]
MTERALSTTNGYGGTDEAGTNGESVPTRVGRYLETTLVPAEGPSVPVEFELGVATPDETSDPVDFAPPVGARILILDDPGRDVLRPILGLWTVVETDGGGFVLGGPGVDERTSVDGQTTFDGLLQALNG